ncbi:hypothetical protein AALO_G00101970 [Alosa alosa]|uniref:G-protein coupled receptors family 1 profile domain-containing protein n=1 Tax=Alosa alosa TaxID=278164 RepID=A0AAV6GY33_9TELE|nr:C-C chemokine receptor type 7 [Alosa alosa]KAG5278716.1 hypothetical protein AALO_G00101970 [Alosa alosa]
MIISTVKVFGLVHLLLACQLTECVGQENTTEMMSPNSPGMVPDSTIPSVDNATDVGLTTDYTYDVKEDYYVGTYDYANVEYLCEKGDNRQFRAWFLPTVYSVICFMALVGNSLVILTYIYFSRLKTMTDIYLLSLGIADLLFALTLPFWAASIMAKWVLGTFLCKAMHAVYRVTFFSGMFLLTSISVDRYFAITKAVSAHRCRSRAIYVSKVSSLVIWLVAVLFSIPEMIYTHVSANDTCDLYYNQSKQLVVGMQVTQMVLGFAVPALVMVFCYSSIVRTLALARSFEKNKAVKVIFAVVSVFLICQIPYNIVLVLKTVNTATGGTKDCFLDNALMYAIDVTSALAFLRCCVNPFLYAFIGVKFRHDLLKLLKDLGCMSPALFYELTSCTRRRSLGAMETETTTSFSP